MSDEYSVWIGARRGRKPARYLYKIPARKARDDGRILLHAGGDDPVCADCGVGHLLWAEAGYVPYHRICDVCGSHWDLHPIMWGPGKSTRCAVTHERTGEFRCGHDLPEDATWCEECNDEPLPILREIPGPEYVRWVDGRGEIALDPSEPLADYDGPIAATWGDLLALIRPEHWTQAERDRERMAGQIVVPCAWARRARFY